MVKIFEQEKLELKIELEVLKKLKRIEIHLPQISLENINGHHIFNYIID